MTDTNEQDFAAVFMQHAKGRAHTEASKKLAEVVEAVMETAPTSVRVDTTADLELGRDPIEDWVNVASVRPATITPLMLDDGRGARIRFAVDLGALADHAEVIVPFAALAEFVDQVREGDLDGFEDALDHRPPRGRSRKYIDAYTLGEVEARGRAE